MPRRSAPRQGPLTALAAALVLVVVVVLALLPSGVGAFGFGDYRIDFDFLGGEGDLRPEQYREYIRGKTPGLPAGRQGKYPSPLWYLYSADLPKVEREAQLAEVRHVEQQLGVKFWKVKVDSSKKARFLKGLAEAAEPPAENRMPRRFREEMQPRGAATPFFYNLNTGRGISGLTSSTNLKKWALGKEFKADPWQGFTSPQFQDLLAKMGDDGEKEYLEKYSDQAWVMRYRKERDAALRAHKRQYRRRQVLSKFGLARAPVSDRYERFMDVDRLKELDQEERRGWVPKRRTRPQPPPVLKAKLSGKGGGKKASRR